MGVLLIDKSSLSDGLAYHRIHRVRSQSADLSGVRDALVTDAVFPDAVFPDAVFPDAVFPDAVQVAHGSLLDEKKLPRIHKGPNDISISSSALSLHLPHGRFSIRGIGPAAENGHENIVNL